MYVELVALRLLHITAGAFWVGTSLFSALFLLPSIQAAGPSASGLLRRLFERAFGRAIPIAALVTVLAGLRLYWRMSLGFSSAWVHSPSGLCYTAGGILGVAAFVVGAAHTGPTGGRLMKLLPQSGEALSGEAQAVMSTLAASVRWAAFLVTAALTLMAIARYV
jgi:uncharacterized membrane protein